MPLHPMSSRVLEDGTLPVDLNHPDNAAVLHYLRSINELGFPAFFRQEEEDRWYFFWRKHKPASRYGSHPDASAWLFERVAPRLPGSGFRIVYGRDCLIHPQVGLVLGFCQGMCFALKLQEPLLPEAWAAIEAHHRILHPANRDRARKWARTVRDIGPGWVPGIFETEEARRFGEAYDTGAPPA